MSLFLRVFFLLVPCFCFSAFISTRSESSVLKIQKSNARVSYLRAIRSNRFRITGAELLDQGMSGAVGTGIDTKQDLCSAEDEDPVYEPFNDSLVRLYVTNGYAGNIFVRKVGYRIRDADGNGRTHRATRLSPIGVREVPADSSGNEILAFFMEMQGADKVFAGADFTLPEDLGFRTVVFVLRGRDHLGNRIVARLRTTLSFDNFDRCS
ncbi:MAG: hypothetical protein KDD55_03830 [Bdellovibrionales bacterium]|nr:hypothetical protein [Bdellovibrionales bacterium]